MSDLSPIEKIKLEKLFGMESGYVMNFTNKTFQEFILSSTNLDIMSEKYNQESGSKANRLRAFWKKENNYTIGILTKELLDLCEIENPSGLKEESSQQRSLFEQCQKIVKRLQEGQIVPEIDAIKEDLNDKNITMLVKSIKDSIEKNEPEVALDRLHTYLMKYFRQLCVNHEITINRIESLNALYGKYVNFIVKSGYIESQMTEKILKYSINVIEAFNDIRNNKSFAHDNPILNYQESLLIFNNLTNSIKFIETVEEKIKYDKERKDEVFDCADLPF